MPMRMMELLKWVVEAKMERMGKVEKMMKFKLLEMLQMCLEVKQRTKLWLGIQVDIKQKLFQ